MTKLDLLNYLKRHMLAVVSTISSDGQPQSALVGIVVTDQMEIIFDSLAATRKVKNLRQQPLVSLVIGWENETTVQYEGIADEPQSEELKKLKEVYFSVYPEGRARESLKDITYVRVRPKWIRHSDFNPNGKITVFSSNELT